MTTLDELYSGKHYSIEFRPTQASYDSPTRITVEKGEPLDLSRKPELQDIAESEWARREEDAKKNNKNLSNGPQYRLGGFRTESDGKELVLELAPAGYKDLISTHGWAFSDRAKFDKFVQAGEAEGNRGKYLGNILAICAAVETGDNYQLIMKRSGKVAEYPGYWHTIGGHPDPKKFQPAGATTVGVHPQLINFYDAMGAEIGTEVGLKPGEYNTALNGLVLNNETYKPELTFSVKTELPLREVLTRPRNERWEAIQFFGLQTKDMEELLRNEKQIVPSGRAALELHLIRNII